MTRSQAISGNNTLIGNGGNDTYEFARGGGQETVVNGVPSNTGATGELDLAAGIAPDQLWLQRSGSDLVLEVMGTQDRVTVQGWYGSTASQLGEIEDRGRIGAGQSAADPRPGHGHVSDEQSRIQSDGSGERPSHRSGPAGSDRGRLAPLNLIDRAGFLRALDGDAARCGGAAGRAPTG